MRPQLVFNLPPPAPLPARLTPRPPLAFNPPPQANLRVVRVRGDGRCLYRAIAKNLACLEDRSLSERLEREDADALRQMAWKEICVDRTNWFKSRHVIEGSINAYCSQMRNPQFFAGEAEMLALSERLAVPISVYMNVDGRLKAVVTYGEQFFKKKNNAVVRVVYSNGNHYDAVLPR